MKDRKNSKDNKDKLRYEDLNISKKPLKEYKAGELVEDAEKIAKNLQISTSQLRKIHSYIVGIWEKYRMSKARKEENFEEIRDKLILLKPILHYNAVRSGGVYKTLEYILKKVIDKVKSPEDFERFKEFYDAIIAYSKK